MVRFKEENVKNHKNDKIIMVAPNIYWVNTLYTWNFPYTTSVNTEIQKAGIIIIISQF